MKISRRKFVSKKGSARSFRKMAGKTKARNVIGAARGGIRL